MCFLFYFLVQEPNDNASPLPFLYIFRESIKEIRKLHHIEEEQQWREPILISKFPEMVLKNLFFCLNVMLLSMNYEIALPILKLYVCNLLQDF